MTHAAPETTPPTDGYCVLPVRGLPELRPGDDLAGAVDLQDGDVLVVASKAVSKVEGRLVSVPAGASREDVRRAAVESETVRVVAREGPAVIAETRHGLVLAVAGVDGSNVRPDVPLRLDVARSALSRATARFVQRWRAARANATLRCDRRTRRGG